YRAVVSAGLVRGPGLGCDGWTSGIRSASPTPARWRSCATTAAETATGAGRQLSGCGAARRRSGGRATTPASSRSGSAQPRGRCAPGRRLARDEYLDVTALATDGVETLALSSTARSPVRVTIEVPRDEVDELAALLAEAQQVIE